MKVYILDNCVYKNVLADFELYEKEIEIDDRYYDCEITDFNEDLTFNVEKYNQRHKTYGYEQELNQLEEWFDYYDTQVAQYNRCQRIGFQFDKDIQELDNQAVVNAKRIKYLRELLK